ncbi:MAG TPA: site-2 protease family protein [Methylomirabilota bacterium]|jgi:Zn-dependent protease/CBS domain-containing protein
MHATVRLGRVHGIEIGLNWTWLIVFGLIVWSLAASAFPDSNPHLSTATYIAMAAAAAVLFFTSLVLHELGHAVVAQREGMQIAGITLWVFGGVARFKGMFPSAGAEFRIAIAGPLVSVLIGVGCLLGARAVSAPPALDGVITWLGGINVALVVFNMLPALPLDGGRVLRSLIWEATGDFGRATRKAGALAGGIGRVMILGGFALLLFAGAIGGLWLSLIGWFVLVAARAETAYGVAHDALSGLHVRDATVLDPVTVQAEITLARFLDDVFADTRYASYPVVDSGEITGLLAVGDVIDLPWEEAHRLTVREKTVGLDQVVLLEDDMDLAEAAAELLGSSLGRGLVTHEQQVVGLISLSDIERMLERRSIRPALGSRPHVSAGST